MWAESLGTSDDRSGGSQSQLVLPSRWQSLSGLILMVVFAGTGTSFGIYSQSLQTQVGLSQGELDFVANMGDTAVYFSIVIGYAIERYGFKKIVVAGCLFCFSGFFAMWMVLNKTITADVISCGLFYFLCQLGACCFLSAAVTMTVKLFPKEHRGSSVGITRGYFGLSSAVLAVLADGFFADSPSNFVLFLSLFIPVSAFYGSRISSMLPPSMKTYVYEHSNCINPSLEPYYYHWTCLFCMLFLLGALQYKLDELSMSSKSVVVALLLFAAYSVLTLPFLYGKLYISMTDIRGLRGYGSMVGEGGEDEGQLVAESDALWLDDNGYNSDSNIFHTDTKIAPTNAKYGSTSTTGNRSSSTIGISESGAMQYRLTGKHLNERGLSTRSECGGIPIDSEKGAAKEEEDGYISSGTSRSHISEISVTSHSSFASHDSYDDDQVAFLAPAITMLQPDLSYNYGLVNGMDDDDDDDHVDYAASEEKDEKRQFLDGDADLEYQAQMYAINKNALHVGNVSKSNSLSNVLLSITGSASSERHSSRGQQLQQQQQQQQQQPQQQQQQLPQQNSRFFSRGGRGHTAGSTIMRSVVLFREKECHYGRSQPLQAVLLYVNFWLIFLCYLVAGGCGLAVVYNVNAIAYSLDATVSYFYVTLISLGNGGGKLISGVLSDELLQYGISKLELLSLAICMMALTQGILAYGSKVLLLPCLLSVGFLNGSSVSLVTVVIADLFGTTHIATTVSFAMNAPALGGYVFSTLMIVMFYQTNHTDDSGNETCVGVNCFRTFFLLNCGCCLAAACLCFYVDTRVLREAGGRV